MEKKRILILILVLGITTVALAQEGSARRVVTNPVKMKQRLEQLFLWRVSDRLHLTTAEETQFNAEFKKIAQEKQGFKDHSEDLATQLIKNKTDKKMSEKLVKDYLDVSDKLAHLSTKEIQTVEKLFGSTRAAEYVLLKREMTKKFKAILAQDRSQSSAVE